MSSNRQTKKLGGICEVVGGGTPDTKAPQYWGNDIYLITPKDLGKLDNFEIRTTERKISKLGLKMSSAKILPPGSVILSSRAPIGHVAINTVEMVTNQGCRNFICSKEIFNKYLYYFLKKNVNLLNELGSGSTFKEISGSTLKTIEISYPDIDEQHRIVKILDEVFTAIAKAKENIEKNLQYSHDLFESYLQSTFDNSGVNWERKFLGEVIQKTETINPLNNPNKEFTYIDVSSVNKETLSIENTSLLKGKDAPSRARKLVKTGDIIFATIRPTLRRIAIISEELNKEICSTGYFVLRTNNQLNNKFLFYFLQTKSFNGIMKKLQKGASYPAVTDREVKNQIINFPKSLSDQKDIVMKLDSLAINTKELEMIYKQKLALLEELKKSLLHQAFTGQL